MTRIQAIVIGFVGLVVALLAVHVWFPQRSGPIALTEVFEPYLIVLAILALPFFVRQRPPWAAVLATALVVIVLIRYVPVFVSTPQPELGPSIRVATWNMLADTGSPERALAGMRDIDADVVGIEDSCHRPPMRWRQIRDCWSGFRTSFLLRSGLCWVWACSVDIR